MNDTRFAVNGLLAAGVFLGGAGASGFFVSTWFNVSLGIVAFVALLAVAVVTQYMTSRRLAESPRTALVATLGSYLGGAVLFGLVIVGTRLVVQAQCGPSSDPFCGLGLVVLAAFVGPAACLVLAGLASIAVLQRRHAQVSKPS